MTDTKEKPADEKIIEEKEKPKKKAKSKPQTKIEKTSSHAGLYTLLSVVVITSCAGLYFLWQQQQQSSFKQQGFNDYIEQKIVKQTADLQQQQKNIVAQTATQIQQVHANQENIHNNITKLIQNNQQLRKDWLMAEAEYLIQLANHRLLLEKDVTTASVALKAADTRLAEISDPSLLKIREVIAQDIQKLNNIQTVDLAGLSVTISALSKNIVNLPLQTPDPKTHKSNKKEKNQTSTEVKGLKDLPAAIWQDLKNLVIIRNHQKPIEPLLSSSQHFFLTQNLALLLEQSRLALLNRQNEIYHERLETTSKWITQYFDIEHNITKNTLNSINEIQKINISPSLPDISSTFSLIKK